MTTTFFHHPASLPKLLVLLLASLPLFAATETSPLQNEGSLQYVGDSARLSVGVAKGGKFYGEWLGLLSETANNAWLGQLWYSDRAGGGQLSFNHARGTVVDQYFAAYDRNAAGDGKLTAGYGLQQGDWFGAGYLSQGLSSRRLVGSSQTSSVSSVEGSEGSRLFRDTTTTTIVTRQFERAYRNGLGLRAGRDWTDANLRTTFGVDHEWGEQGARQTTTSLSLEKHFGNGPHSMALQLDHASKSGPFDAGRSSNRFWLSYRYDFGAVAFRSERLYRTVTETTPAVQPPAPAPKTETRMVKTTVSMASDAFFELGKARLTDKARSELDRIAGLLRQQGREGNIHLVGHGCDLGSDAANMRVSRERAEAVRDYLIAQGVVDANTVVLEARGKREPKFPAKPDTRHLNRRVDLEFVTFESRSETVTLPAVEPAVLPPVTTVRREEVVQEPVWLRRALRSPIEHKRSVDVYRVVEESRSDKRERSYINRAPLARDASFTAVAGVAVLLPVLQSASDPDGDALTVVRVGSAQGQVSIENGQLRYLAPASFTGSDRFSYTVKDAGGLEATATVTVKVSQPNRAPTARNDSFTVSGASSSVLDVLANDSDPDGDAISIVSLTQPAGGTGTVSIENGKVRFEPKGVFGVDTFTYTIRDAGGLTSTAIVTLIDP
ncbi:Ig-like domain-containing protein [Chitinimonas sp.]|uniref:Ig-like domain-containing protein n=1 Tax=Chitinimonas sp. TaxID=1934313 RepID=UPI0035B06699